MMTTTTTPSSSSDANSPQPLLDALAPVLQKLAPEQAPLLLAALERMAADKYRAWADQTQDTVEKKGLLDCADREEAISEFIESLEEGNKHFEERMAALKDLIANTKALYDEALDGHDRKTQFQLQAAGELGGANFMRQFREAHGSGPIAAQFEALALGEEANSKFLSVLVESM